MVRLPFLRSVVRALTLPSPIEWVYLGAGIALLLHYRWLFDDAFIYFRYVDNLLFLDSGLTYNRGEYVEGYTSPGFCFLLVLLRSLGLDWVLIVDLLGIASFTTFWAMLVALNRRLLPASWSGGGLNFPLAYLGTNYAVSSFFTSGLETPLVHLAAVAYALFLLRPTNRALAVVVAGSPLVRPELAVPLVLAGVWAWRRTGRFPAFLGGAAAAINGSFLLFRIYYYADLLPNTFYLKDGTRVALGWEYLRDVTDTFHAAPVAVVFALVWLFLRRRGDEEAGLDTGARAAMLGVSLAATAYVVKMGGGHMRYYYLAFPFVLAACSTAGLLERFLVRVGWRRRRGLETLTLASFSFLVLTWYPPVLSKHPALLHDKDAETPSGKRIGDPVFHRHSGALRSGWQERVDIPTLRAFAPTLREEGYRRWTPVGWCQRVYVQFGARSVHRYGLTDAILARVDTPTRKRGHKRGLHPLADDLIELQKQASTIDRGMYREAVEAGRAPEWIVQNLETIEVLEAKMYNRHDLLENVRLALTFPPRIRL